MIEWSSSLQTYTSSGKGERLLDGYQEVDLLSHEGSGCLTHMWFGGNWPGYEKTRIRVYIDGEATPSINMQLGMGHGMGFISDNGPWGSQRSGKTGKTSGIYNTYRISYGTQVRVTAQRSLESPNEQFWWIIRGTDGLRVVIGDVVLPICARLKLYTVEDHLTTSLEELDLCDVRGPGAVYCIAIAGQGLVGAEGTRSFAYLEGCIRAYYNGSSKAELLSSGYEDYFLGTYYFQKGKYSNSLAGVTYIDNDSAEIACYRFHDEDPILFQTSLRLTCRNGDTEHGTDDGVPYLNPANTMFTTYTWIYQW